MTKPSKGASEAVAAPSASHIDPIDLQDPLRLDDRVVARGAEQYYQDQAELNAEAIRLQMLEAINQVGLVQQDYQARIARLQELLKPKVFVRKATKKILRAVKHRLVRYGRVLIARRDALQIPRFTDIYFTQPAEPVVSVIIPVYNLLPITLACLRSILRQPERVPFEIIVVDDASPDPLVQSVLKRIPGITYVRQPQNGGFVRSCNAGASRARAPILYFLNNDTEVWSNWLTPIVQLYQDRTVGAVGSKMVYPKPPAQAHWTLQEAGGIVFKSGEAWNYGRTDRADLSHYNFIRDVDFCSGAGLSIRRDLFERIGGFNLALAPGYYEDVELCFAVRDLGYRVLYQPLSVVTHYEGASSASKVLNGQKPMKAYQIVNGQKFKHMRVKELTQQWPKELEKLPLIARRKRGMRIWFFEWFIPMFDRDYGSARTVALLRELARHHTVTFVARDITDKPRYREFLQNLGVEVVPRGVGSNLTHKLAVEGKYIDLAIVARPDVMHYFYHLLKRFAPQAPIIYDTVDIHHMRLERELARTTEPRKCREIQGQITLFKTLELEYGRRSDAIWAITPADQTNLLRLLPGKQVDIVSAAHEANPSQRTYAEREGLMYIGSFHHPPNIASMEFYINEINPHLQRLVPGLTLSVIGQAVPEWLKRLARDKAGETVKFIGTVSDAGLEQAYERARLFVAPVTFGSGLKGKVVMAMSRGLPVVATSMAAEGIPARDGLSIDLADEPQLFAQKIAALYLDNAVWQMRSQAALKVVRTHYSEQHFAQEINDSFAKLTSRL